jgi:hypothetical protein
LKVLFYTLKKVVAEVGMAAAVLPLLPATAALAVIPNTAVAAALHLL